MKAHKHTRKYGVMEIPPEFIENIKSGKANCFILEDSDSNEKIYLQITAITENDYDKKIWKKGREKRKKGLFYAPEANYFSSKVNFHLYQSYLNQQDSALLGTEHKRKPKNQDLSKDLNLPFKIPSPSVIAILPSFFEDISSRKTSYVILEDSELDEKICLQIRNLNPKEWNQAIWHESIKREKSIEKKAKQTIYQDKTNYPPNKHFYKVHTPNEIIYRDDIKYFSNKINVHKSHTHNINHIISFIEYNIEFFLEEENFKLLQAKNPKEKMMVDLHEAINGKNKFGKKIKGLRDGNRKLIFKVLDQNPTLRETLKGYMNDYRSSPINNWYNQQYQDRDKYIKWLAESKNKAVTLQIRSKLFEINRSKLSEDKKQNSIRQVFLHASSQIKESKFFGRSKTKDALEKIIHSPEKLNVQAAMVPHQPADVTSQLSLISFDPLSHITQQLDMVLDRTKTERDTELIALKENIQTICEDQTYLYTNIKKCRSIRTAIKVACENAREDARSKINRHLPSFLSFFPGQSNLADALETFNNDVVKPLIKALEIKEIIEIKMGQQKPQEQIVEGDQNPQVADRNEEPQQVFEGYQNPQEKPNVPPNVLDILKKIQEEQGLKNESWDLLTGRKKEGETAEKKRNPK